MLDADMNPLLDYPMANLWQESSTSTAKPFSHGNYCCSQHTHLLVHFHANGPFRDIPDNTSTSMIYLVRHTLQHFHMWNGCMRQEKMFLFGDKLQHSA